MLLVKKDGTESGFGDILFTILICLFVLSTLFLAAVYHRYSNYLSEREKLQNKLSAIDSDIKTLTVQKDKLTAPRGPSGFSSTDKDKTLPTGEVLNEVSVKRKLFYPGQITDEVSQQFENSRLYGSYIEVVHLALDQLLKLKSQYEFLKLQEEELRNKISIISGLSTDSGTKRKLKEEIDALISDITKKINSINQSVTSTQKKYDGIRSDLEDKIAREQRNLVSATQTLKLQVESSKSKLRELLNSYELIKYVPQSWHGRVVNVNIKDRLAYVNMGSKNRVREGMVFLVSKPTDIGIFNYKGKVAVRKVWLESSELEIRNIYDDKEPVIDGDILVNPFFDKDKELVVMFSGANRIENSRLTLLDAAKKAIQYGCRLVYPKDVKVGDEIVTSLPHDIDFLVYGGPQEKQLTHLPEYITALEIGVPVADPADLITFLED